MKLIHQIAKETGFTIATVRFYEKNGLFKSSKINPNNKYAYYDESVVEKLALIGDAKSAGFTLAEIKELIDAWYNKKISTEKKLHILDKKLEQLSIKIKELQNVKKVIVQFKKDIAKELC